ncbi:MAG: aromatic ring-hydroxylating dioxygenase subunit alpha [Pseudomonadota bacterium]
MIMQNSSNTTIPFVDTLSAEAYTSNAFLQQERHQLFGNTWLYAADLKQFPELNTLLPIEVAGYPILLVRDKQGDMHAWHNLCRHRGMMLVPSIDPTPTTTPQFHTPTTAVAAQKTGNITCKYHGWTYASSGGELVSAPFCPNLNQQDTKEMALSGIRTEVWNNMVFINLNPEAPSLKEERGEMLETIEASGFEFDQYELEVAMVVKGNFNWKIWIEGYQECYHCPTVHPVLQRDFSLIKYKIENRQLFSIHSCQRKNESNTGGFEGLWLWAWPNLGMPFYQPAFYTLRVNPRSANETVLEYAIRFRKDTPPEQRQEFMDFINCLTLEDIAMCEAVQKNMEAGIYHHGHLHPDRENGVIYFHNLVRTATANPANPANS